MGKNTDGSFSFLLRQFLQQFCRKVHSQKKVSRLISKTTGGIRLTVTVGDIGFDIENRCSVHQIRSANMEYRAVFLGVLHIQQSDTGQSQVIGTERGAGCKYPHSGVSTQAWRTNGWRPAFPHRFRKLPDDPKMGKILNSPKCIIVPIFRLKNNGGAKLLYQAALPGNAEFCGKIAVHPGNDVDRYFFHRAPPFFY